MEYNVEEIQARIKSLETAIGEDLKNEMLSLKQALMDNPSACALLLDEDIGKMVSALRNMTGQAVASAAASKTTRTTKAASAKPKKMTAEELARALDDM